MRGDEADGAPYCVVVPRELVERLATLAPADAERVLRAWGDTDELRFTGRSLPEERYRAAVAHTFGHFRRLCQLARATGRQVYLYIAV